MCVCVCVRACMCACVCACMRSCMHVGGVGWGGGGACSQKFVFTMFCSLLYDGLCAPVRRNST